MYPRSTGYPKVHYIPAEIVTPEDETVLLPEELAKGLQYLQSQSADLKWGDFVAFQASLGYRNDGLAMFNGREIVELETETDDYGTLPQQFRIITNGVPIDYWHGNQQPYSHICHNTHVWFDLAPVRDQCLANIRYAQLEDFIPEEAPVEEPKTPADRWDMFSTGNWSISSLKREPITEKWVIFTTFEYEGKTYRIIFDLAVDHDDDIDTDTCKLKKPEMIDQIFQEFHDILSVSDLIPFYLYDMDSSYQQDDHTLFVNIRCLN